MVLSDTDLTNLLAVISFLVKIMPNGMIVSTSGLGMPDLQGNFTLADADDGMQKLILFFSPSKVRQF